MDRAMRIFFVLIMTIVVSEFAAIIFECYYGTNNELYNAADVVQSILIFWYFSINLKKPILGTLLMLSTLVFGVVNYYFVQSESLVNNYFLLWSGTIVIGLCLYQMSSLAQRQNSIRLIRSAHFLIAFALLCYWVINMLNFQLFNYVAMNHTEYAIFMNIAHLCSNIITYLSFAFIFFHLSKLIQ
ncbi:hypothetical protein [uncultured Pedobacter sp.]|uniref:hypothetical protein n=1 Tax=uncultured Pedobacter sp. TaxID=246139 RepID=UPI0026315B13|nr:hypothetical protein [uncultured Pedobacter sp.]